MRQVPLSPLSFDPQRVANVPEHPPPSTRLRSCAHIANRRLSRIIGASTFLILKRRNSCATPPLLSLRAVSVPSEMCLPSALARSNSGEARSTNFWIERSLPFTLPTPPPPPVCGGSSDSPQLHASTSISPLCLASTDSPSIPASLRNISAGMASPSRTEPAHSRPGKDLLLQRQRQIPYLAYSLRRVRCCSGRAADRSWDAKFMTDNDAGHPKSVAKETASLLDELLK